MPFEAMPKSIPKNEEDQDDLDSGFGFEGVGTGAERYEKTKELVEKLKQSLEQIDTPAVRRFLDRLNLFTKSKPKEIQVDKTDGNAENINIVRRVEIGGLSGYVKDGEGETVTDANGNMYRYSAASGGYEPVLDTKGVHQKASLNEEDEKRVKKTMTQTYQLGRAEIIADSAGVYDSQERERFIRQILNQKTFTPRIDIPPGEAEVRGMSVSLISSMMGFDIVPPVAVKAQQGMMTHEASGTTVVGHKNASFIETVRGVNPEHPPRPIKVSEFADLLTTPTSQWGEKLPQGSNPEVTKKSIARLAALDWLVGSMDAHFENLFIDPATGKITMIDPDLAFPRGRAKNGDIIHNKTEKEKKGLKDPGLIDRKLRSVNLELSLMHEDIALDAKDREQLFKLHEALLRDSPERQSLMTCFEMMFPANKKEALSQFEGYVQRLEELAESGRPSRDALRKNVHELYAERAIKDTDKGSEILKSTYLRDNPSP